MKTIEHNKWWWKVICSGGHASFNFCGETSVFSIDIFMDDGEGEEMDYLCSEWARFKKENGV